MISTGSIDDDDNSDAEEEEEKLVDLTEYVVIQKIIASFYQVNSIALSFNYVWPSFITNITSSNSSDQNTTVTTSVYSLDCFLKDIFNGAGKKFMKYY